jgi:hypothetical protein
MTRLTGSDTASAMLDTATFLTRHTRYLWLVGLGGQGEVLSMFSSYLSHSLPQHLLDRRSFLASYTKVFDELK